MKKHIYSMVLALGFLLGVHGSNIALWKDKDPNPIRVFPFCISSLPKADQELLKKGIYAEDLQELRRLLDDYLS